MTDVQGVFLKLVSDYAKGKKTDLSDFNSYNELFHIAKMHELAGIIYVQCRDYLRGTQYYDLFHNEFMNDVYVSVCRTEALEVVNRELRNNGIDYLLVKGQIVSRYYPDERLRTMGDIDIIVKPDDFQKASDILDRLGYERKIENPHVHTFSKNLIIFEIHDNLFYDNLANDFDYISYFKKAWNLYYGNEIYLSCHIVYIIAHIARHLIEKDYGIRPFLDLYLISKDAEIDWEYVEDELKKIKLFDFACNCFGLIKKWFDDEMPFSFKKIDDDFFETVTDKVLSDGLYGLNDMNRSSVPEYAKKTKNSGKPYFWNALLLTLRRIFPKYESMYYIKRYSFIEGKRYLLPVAWVYRWWYCIKYKFKKSRTLLAKPFLSTDDVMLRNEYLSKWGL